MGFWLILCFWLNAVTVCDILFVEFLSFLYDMPMLLVIIGGESCSLPPIMFIILVGESKKSKKSRELLWLGVYPYWFAIIILEISEDNSPKIGRRAP